MSAFTNDITNNVACNCKRAAVVDCIFAVASVTVTTVVVVVVVVVAVL